MSLDDPRWDKFCDADFKCPCCGKSYGGVFDITFDHPDAWPHENRAESGKNAIAVGDDRLGSDLCRLGDDYFARATLRLPIIGTEEVFAYGIWGSLTLESYKNYISDYNGDKVEGFEGCFTWLCNMLPGWSMKEALPCDLVLGSLGQRPSLWVHDDSGHPLFQAQQEGISFDRLLDLYEASGQDVRSHLLDA